MAKNLKRNHLNHSCLTFLVLYLKKQRCRVLQRPSTGGTSMYNWWVLCKCSISAVALFNAQSMTVSAEQVLVARNSRDSQGTVGRQITPCLSPNTQFHSLQEDFAFLSVPIRCLYHSFIKYSRCENSRLLSRHTTTIRIFFNNWRKLFLAYVCPLQLQYLLVTTCSYIYVPTIIVRTDLRHNVKYVVCP